MTKKRKLKQKAHARAERNDMSYSSALEVEKKNGLIDIISKDVNDFIKTLDDDQKYIRQIYENLIRLLIMEASNSSCKNCASKIIKSKAKMFNIRFLFEIYEQIRKETNCKIVPFSDPFMILEKNKNGQYLPKENDINANFDSEELLTLYPKTIRLFDFCPGSEDNISEEEKFKIAKEERNSEKRIQIIQELAQKNLMKKIVDGYIWHFVEQISRYKKENHDIIFCPYVPIMESPTIFSVESFTIKKGIMARYSIVSWPKDNKSIGTEVC